jgi:DNA-binding LacI/PurR family transcriptional regulator
MDQATDKRRAVARQKCSCSGKPYCSSQAAGKAYLNLKLKPQVIKIEGVGWNFEEIGRQGALKILREKGFSTDTVLCSNDRLAIGFLSACHEMGVKVGKTKECDMRIAGNDDSPYSKFTSPPLTTAAHDYKSVSNYAADSLFQLINNGGKSKKRLETVFPAKLIIRESA